MYSQPYVALTLVFSGLFTVATLLPLSVYGQTRRASLVAVEGATKTYQVRDMDGQMVEVTVPSQSLSDVRTNQGQQTGLPSATEQARATVPAEVVAVDWQTNKVKVLTQARQLLELETPARDLQVGDQITLVVPR